MRRNLWSVIWMITLVLALAAGSAAADTTIPYVEELDADTPLPEPITIEALDIELQWAHDGEFVHVAWTGSADGWISVAFINQGGRMNGANMLIALQDDGEWVVENHVGQGLNHSKTDWPEAAAYTIEENENGLTARVQYPLAFPDGFALDNLAPGETYTLIAAYSDRSGLRNHGRPGRTSFDFSLEEVAE